MRSIALLIGLAAGLFAQAGQEAQRRIESLENKLLAPCCWAETIAGHRSDVALQMKAEIASFVAEGQTDRQILDYYKRQYGERILVEPEGARWWVMNVVPAGLLVCGLLAAVLIVRRWLRPLPSSSPR
jgi:cytochrome c-type biogenesis protein CcmH